MPPPSLESYDALPYDSVPITDTHPDHLRALARLFGVPAQPAHACRVLELGCADGGNLIPLAFHLPGSECVGIDLAGTHVAQANDLIGELGLGNVRVMQRSVSDDLTHLGQFDYIIAHGLFSWVPRAVQDKVLEVCARQLAPHGIAYISYNTLPGWHDRAALRDMLLAYCDAGAAPVERLRQAHRLFDFLDPALALRTTPDARVLQDEIAHLRRAPPSYVYHEYLEEHNEPIWFSTFIARAQAAGLDYLADAGLASMLPATLGEATAQALRGLNDRLRVEQLMDYARQRKFRRTLLVRRGVEVYPAPELDALDELAYHADLGSDEEIDLGSALPQTFRLAAGGECRIAHPLAKAAALNLALRYPDRLGWQTLLHGAQQLLSEHGAARHAEPDLAFRTEWFSLVAHQSVRLSAAAETLAVDVAPRPRAHALARAQARRGRVLASVRHTAVELDAFGALLVQHLDGSLDLAGMTELLMRTLQARGQPEPDRAALQTGCHQLLWTLARAGLLQAPD